MSRSYKGIYTWENIYSHEQRLPIHHVTYAMPNARNVQRKLYICYKKLPHTQLKKSNTHQAPPANEWMLLDLEFLDLGVWWKYRLVGHVWVHGSKLSFLSLRCLLLMVKTRLTFRLDSQAYKSPMPFFTYGRSLGLSIHGARRLLALNQALI
jgi:hypothetical protein